MDLLSDQVLLSKNVKEFSMSLEAHGNQPLWRVLVANLWNPGGARKFEKERFVFNFCPL